MSFVDTEDSPIVQLVFDHERKRIEAAISESGFAIKFRSAVATHNELQQGCSSIAHFSMHGEDGNLRLEYSPEPFTDKIGSVDVYSLSKIKPNSNFKPKLVFLSACESELMGHTFVSVGVPHVIAIKTGESIDDDAIRSFTTVFYKFVFSAHTIQSSFELAVDDLKRAYPEEANKILLLPFEGDHNVELVLPPKGDIINQSPKQPMRVNLKPHSPNMIGRSKELVHLYRAIHAYFDNIIVLRGPPQIGKTEVSLRVLNYSLDRCEFDMYIMFQSDQFKDVSEKELPFKLAQSLRNHSSKFDEDSKEILDIADFLSEYYSDSDIMMLFDNFDLNCPHFFKFIEFLSRPNNIRLLVTTSTPISEPLNQCYVIELTGLKVQESKDLYWDRFLREPNEDDEQRLTKSVDVFQGCPLPIIRAAIESSSRYHFCIAVLPLSSSSSHSTGYAKDELSSSNLCENRISFEKQYLVSKIKTYLLKQSLSASIFSVPDRDKLSQGLASSCCAIYLGTGVGYEAGCQNILLSCSDTLPKTVVICLKYGAKLFSAFYQKNIIIAKGD